MAAVFSLPRVVVEAENSLPALGLRDFGASSGLSLRPCASVVPAGKKRVDILRQRTKLHRIVYINHDPASLSRTRTHTTRSAFCEFGGLLQCSCAGRRRTKRESDPHDFENQTSCSSTGGVAVRDNRLCTGESRHPGAESGVYPRRLPPLRWLRSRRRRRRTMPEAERVRTQRRVPIGVRAKRKRCARQKHAGYGSGTTNSTRDLARRPSGPAIRKQQMDMFYIPALASFS